MLLYARGVLEAIPFTRSELGWQLAGVAIGFLLFSIGVAALALFLFRRASTDYTLVYFGVFAILYAIRLLFRESIVRVLFPESTSGLDYLDVFIDCFIAVPFGLFLLQIVDSTWQKVLRWFIGAQIVFGVTRLVSSLVHVGEPAMKLANNIFVICSCVLVTASFVFARPLKNKSREIIGVFSGLGIFALFVVEANLADLGILPRHHNIEAVGFFLFVSCLGYVAAHRTLTKEEHLLEINKELQIATKIQSSILPREIPRLPGLEIVARYVPMGAVAGDFYDFLVVDDRRIGVLVADVTGHGVPAALIASMLKVAFAAQLADAQDPARVLAGINRALCGKFEEHFVTAAYVFLDLEKSVLRYAGAGHPPILVTPLTNRISVAIESREIEANGLMLGLFPDAEYSAIEVPLGAGDRVLLYTDGILEAMNTAHEEFGKLRLKKLIEMPAKTATQLADTLLQETRRWSGSADGRTQDDDITLLVLEID